MLAPVEDRNQSSRARLLPTVTWLRPDPAPGEDRNGGVVVAQKELIARLRPDAAPGEDRNGFGSWWVAIRGRSWVRCLRRAGSHVESSGVVPISRVQRSVLAPGGVQPRVRRPGRHPLGPGRGPWF
ncbi:hypothetical protein ABGB07_19670 [Micromonosporaceae bacterium B7E4]